jgi:hypothetical protein
VFDKIPYLDVVSATTITGQFARRQKYKEATQLFSRILFIYIYILRPMSSHMAFYSLLNFTGDLKLGRQFHACAMKIGLSSIVFAGSAILDLNAKLGSTEEAQRAFEDIQNPNVVSRPSG